MKTFLKIVYALALAGLTGCTRPDQLLSADSVSVRTKVPEIQEVSRPTLEEFTPGETAEFETLSKPLREKIARNVLKLKEYGEEEHVLIHDFDAFAKINNQMSDSEAGTKSIRRTKP